MTKDWFASWFDSPYYHILYKNRDHNEAEGFINNLTQNLKLEQGSHILDLACGKGRHTRTLNELGFNVLGVDLSPNSISSASMEPKDNLEFAVHDMREVIENRSFDAIFNLFTSFGYFDSEKDNLKMLNSIHTMLNENGLLVIDFMNASKVISNLVHEETKVVDNVRFNITREYDGEHIYKNIQFDDKKQNMHYTERVQAVKMSDFDSMLKASNFEILRTFGDFDLIDFNEETSDRLIIIAQKK